RRVLAPRVATLARLRAATSSGSRLSSGPAPARIDSSAEFVSMSFDGRAKPKEALGPLLSCVISRLVKPPATCLSEARTALADGDNVRERFVANVCGTVVVTHADR